MGSRLARKLLISLAALAAVIATRTAHAEDAAPTGDDAADAGPAQPAAAPAADAGLDVTGLPADYIGTEVIEVFAERPDKPFDRDTELRLTGEELKERGVTNLAEALELVGDIDVRAAGRGGRQIDIRGARKGSIKILIDGVSVDDPYYGNFDVSSIPVTDIVQIRVSSSPASPIEGIGGPGGVVEVHTRDAVGGRRIEARVQGDSLPSGMAAVTGRSMIGERFAIRTSAAGTMGSRDFTMPGATLDENRHLATGTLRLEYRDGDRRVVGDVWLGHRAFVVPPGEDDLDDILVVDGETSARASVLGDDHLGRWQLQASAYAHAIDRQSTYFEDPQLTMEARAEDLQASRLGGGFLANRPLGKTFRFIAAANLDSEDASVMGFDGQRAGGRASVAEASTGLQFEDGPVRIDSAAGIAVPIGLGADPWPEAKLVARYRPVRAFTLKLTGARKGRAPTLRERFRIDIGNQALGPEHALFGEVAAEMQPTSWLDVTVASYVRDTNGLIRFDGNTGALGNTGDLQIRGFDSRVELGKRSIVGGGARWSFTDAYAEDIGTDPLDFLPAHRADAWVTVTPLRAISATARVRHVSERIDRNMVLPGYTTADLSAFARVSDALFGSVRVDNLTDERYDIRGGGVLSPGRVIVVSVGSVLGDE